MGDIIGHDTINFSTGQMNYFTLSIQKYTTSMPFYFPGLITKLIPGNGDRFYSDSVYLKWKSFGDSCVYHVQVSSDTGFANPFIDTTLSDTMLSLIDNSHWGVNTESYFYWRVCGINPLGQGSYGVSWYFTLFPTAVYENKSSFPTFFVSSNYPNPFASSTTIDYTLPESSPVSLKIFNALGEQVATLINGFQHSGNQSVQFSGDGLPNGICFYRLTAGKFSQTGKMIIIR